MAQVVAGDLLAAEIRYQASPARNGSEQEPPIRRFTMHPNQACKDARTGVAKHNLKEMWNGKIDEFLLAFINQES